MDHPGTSHGAEEAAAAFTTLRPRLVGVAYGLLGSVAESEDVVQEAWIRLQRSDRDAIEDLTGWLVTTTSRLALDSLRSARRRRETYVGPWLPEPVETAPDPADTVSLVDSLSWAMLVVLETLSPAERAAFVLHDVFGLSFPEVGRALGRTPVACRKLASRARAHVEARRPRFDVDPGLHGEVLQAFGTAIGSGDLDGLLRLLHPGAVLTSDGGGVVTALTEPLRGGRAIAEFLVRVVDPSASTLRSSAVNGGPGLLVLEGDRVVSVLAIGVRDGLVCTLDAIRNPHKFHGLRPTTAGDE